MSSAVQNDLLLRAAEAREALRACDLCARRCVVDRTAGPAGYCGLGERGHFFREMMVYGIEMELIPAHAVYLTGCNMRCAFCNVLSWNVKPEAGEAWDAGWMAGRVRQRQAEGAKCLLLLGGEPTVNLPDVLEMLARLERKPMVAWDSNMLLSERARTLLEGVVDIYVADLKFGNNRCALELGDVDAYLEILQENFAFAEKTAQLIVRHLMIPGHFECCTLPAMAWLVDKVSKPRLSLFWGYQATRESGRHAELAGSVGREEYRRARELAEDIGIEIVE